MLLTYLTWKEVELYLERSKGIIIPIGAVEQHGPTGVLGTDAICAETTARMAGDLAKALVGPTINIGMSLHHTAFPGTISLKPTTLISVIVDYVTSLARAGFRRFFFVNGHGGNIPSANAAFYEAYEKLSPAMSNTLTTNVEKRDETDDQVRIQLVSWYDCPEVKKIVQEYFGDEEGLHATPGEISITLFACPQAVKYCGNLEKAADHSYIFSAKDFRKRYPDGRIGSNPMAASPEIGRELAHAASRELADMYKAFLTAD